MDALEGVRIAQSRKSRNAAASRRGWDVGTLRSSDIGANGETTFSYQVTVPRFFFGPRVKVALAWDSLAAVIDVLWLQVAIDQLKLDLDLHVFDSRGNQVGYSGSWDNSYEIAEFPAVAARRTRSGSTASPATDDVWFGVAWRMHDSASSWSFDWFERFGSLTIERLSPRRQNGAMSTNAARTREINDSIRYTMWSVFRLDAPLGDADRAARGRRGRGAVREARRGRRRGARASTTSPACAPTPT